MVTRVGTEVAMVELYGQPGVERAGVETLAAAQVACLTAGGCAKRVPTSDGFLLPPWHADDRGRRDAGARAGRAGRGCCRRRHCSSARPRGRGMVNEVTPAANRRNPHTRA